MAKATITVPSNVIPIDNNGQKQFFIFELLVLWAINGDRRFNGDGPGIRASVRIETEVSKLPPIEVDEDGTPKAEQAPRTLVLKAEDRALLLEALNNPAQMNGSTYPISPARPLISWIDAVEAAEVED